MERTGKLIIKYTVFFAVLAAAVFVQFVLMHKSLIQYGDGYHQGYFWVAEIHKNLQNMIAGEGLPYWGWYRGTGLEVGVITDPFNVLAALFPAGYMELGYSVAVILRMYCSGLAFLLLLREVKLSSLKCTFGALAFVFSTWCMALAMNQGHFLLNTILFPLLVLGVEKIYRDRSPVLFMVIIALYMIRSSYCAYMAAIGIIIYIIVRYFAFNDKFRLKEFAPKIGAFMLYGIVGIGVSVFIFLTAAASYSNASMESGSDTWDLFCSVSEYLKDGCRLVSEGEFSSYSTIGIPILLLIILPVAVTKISRKSTNTIMSIIFGVMLLMPIFSTMFNGFGYPTNRWYFMPVMFMIWTGVEHFDVEELKRTKNLIIMAAAWVVLFAWTFGLDMMDAIDIEHRAKWFLFFNLAGGAGLILLLFLSGFKGETRRWETVIAVLSCVLIAAIWNVAEYDNLNHFVSSGNINKQLSESTQRVGNQIDDDGFYRVDQVDGLNLHKSIHFPVNENYWWQTRGLYIYDSRIPSSQLYLNKLVGNNYGYNKRVYVLSNDNRMGLDFLFGVKYFLGDDAVNDRTGSDEYAGYGFSYKEQIDGVNIFENKYDSGIGFAYDRYMSQSEFEKLSRLEREQALLQAAVVPDSEMADITAGTEVKAEDLRFDIDKVAFDVTEQEGVSVDLDAGEITVEDVDDAHFTIGVNGVSDSQLMISFDNLILGEGETSEDFKLYCENEQNSQKAINETTSQSIPNIRDYDLNMGYYKQYDGEIEISLSRPGTYTFDDFRVSAMKTSNYDKFASERLKNKFEVQSFNDKIVRGVATLEDDGIMFFSIPKFGNWSVYIDGQKADRINNLNITFMGAQVEKGTHEITLKYNFSRLIIGIVISLAALAALIVIGLLHRRKKK